MGSYKEVEQWLIAEAEPDFCRFTSGLMPGVEQVLGVRLPKLRKKAKELAKGDFRNFLEKAPETSYEMRMLKGLVIGYAKGLTVQEHLALAAWFVPKIDNWSVCDVFCSGLKFAREAKEEVWAFLQLYFASEEPYAIRFAFVMALDYYIEEPYLMQIFAWADRVNHENYYVKMAVAWALSMCCVKYPAQTESYLDTARLDDFTMRKTVQKVCESLQADDALKQRLKGKFRKKRKQREI